MIFLIRRIIEKKIGKTVVKVDESELCIACGSYVPEGQLLCLDCLRKAGGGCKELNGILK